VIAVLSLTVGLGIPNDRGALAVALAAVSGVAIGVSMWPTVFQRLRLRETGPAPAMQSLVSRAYLVPRELPPGPAGFVGRAKELQRLEDTIRRSRNADPFVAVIYGASGIGKSALAVTFAHKVAPLFPAGQLFVPMRSIARQSGRPQDLIAYFVGALRSPNDRVYASALELQAEYLELTRHRSVLFVLDDMPADFDISAIRPSSPSCAFIVTCRGKPDWSAASCEWVQLGELAESEALEMLRTAIGEGRVDKEEQSSRDLASRCGLQPQALRAAGTAVANRPDWDIRLILNQAGPTLTTRARGRRNGGTFDAVYALLTSDEQEALLALGVMNRSDFMPWMLAAALGTTEARARRLASRLADAGLIERYNPGSGTSSYLAEEPLLAYASTLVTDDDFADVIRRRLAATENGRRDESLDALDELIEHNGGFTPAIDKVRSAMSSAQERRSHAGEAEACAALADLYVDLGDMVAAEELAGRALELGGGHSGARAHRCMVRIERRRHQLVSAIQHADLALALASEAGDLTESVRTLQEKAVVLAMMGMLTEAQAAVEEALRDCDLLGLDGVSLRPGVEWCRGTVLLHARQYAKAMATLTNGKQKAVEQGRPRMGAWIDLARAHVAFETRAFGDGERFAAAAMDAFTSLRHRYGTAHCRHQLGQIYLAWDRVDEASRYLREALETFHNCADNWIEGEVSLALAEAYRRHGRVRDAAGLQRAAEHAFRRMNEQVQARRARRELVRTLLTGTLPARLRMLWSAAPLPDSG
jgi:tetratricopeptide (TPR) repeat protein